ncbi:hypothetical protein JCM31598_28090 [Desulfonatronum parangueonense]
MHVQGDRDSFSAAGSDGSGYRTALRIRIGRKIIASRRRVDHGCKRNRRTGTVLAKSGQDAKRMVPMKYFIIVVDYAQGRPMLVQQGKQCRILVHHLIPLFDDMQHLPGLRFGSYRMVLQRKLMRIASDASLKNNKWAELKQGFEYFGRQALLRKLEKDGCGVAFLKPIGDYL